MLLVMRTSKRILVSDKDRVQLEQVVRNGNTPQKVALRARIALLSADGVSTGEMMRELGTTTPTITRWRPPEADETAGGAGPLQDRSRPGRKRRIGEAKVREVVERTLREKPPHTTHWSTRSLAAVVGLSPPRVQR